MHSSVREILVSSQPDSSYFLRVEGSGRGLASGFQVLLSDGRRAWRGEASEASVCREADELEMSEEKYVRDLQEALMGAGSADSYRFDLAPSPPDGGAALTLTYDKVRKDISFRLGSVSLSPIPEPSEAVRGLLTHSLLRGTSLDHQNQELREQNRRLRQEHQRITAELKRYANGKEDLEAELYSRFVLVLNEKKAKIRSLQERLKGLRDVSSDAKKEPVEGDRAAKGEEDDEYGGSTDDDDDDDAVAPSHEARPCSPSPLDDSLRDITDVAPSRKRRFRHLGASDAAFERPHARGDSPGATNQQPPPLQRHCDVSAAEAEDLFEDF
ncbi:DNA repair protein XRCC4-like isoform X1 [Phyllopteryx taeniolatus]|uniref:DNA repair protein XRCC4-like isoform X1 n=1 Tax=Phyllopteryx taeniolatus TaxID=161469 RepID=UPI002AD3F4DD|nr:DNA repair protein XRCC4-like isoform X1 [Phyllopteryx taeniolatus]